MKNRIYLLSFLSALVLFACENRTEVDQETMAQVYVHIVIAEETYLDNTDSLIANKNEIFNLYGISEDEYEYTINNYKEDKEYWDQFFPKALAYLDSLRVSDSR